MRYDRGNPKSVLHDNLERWGGEGSVGWGSGGRGHMHACGRFMLMFGRNHNIIVIPQLK